MYVQDIGGWGTLAIAGKTHAEKKTRRGFGSVSFQKILYTHKESKTHGDTHVQMVCVYPSKVHSRKKKKKLCFFLLQYVKTLDHVIYVLFIARLLFWFDFLFLKLVCRIKATKAKLTCHDLSSSSAVVQLGHGEKEKKPQKNKQSRMDYLSECWPTRVTTAYNPSSYKCGWINM